MGILVLDGTPTPIASALTADGYAQMLWQLLPPSRIWRTIEGVLWKLFLGCADELVRLDQRVTDFLRELDPSTAVELLPDYERVLDVTGGATTEERQARVVARTIARQGFRPVDFQTALAPLLLQDAADVVVIERSRAFCIAIGDDPEIYRFFIYRDPALPGAAFIASAQTLVDAIKPSHTVGTVIESINFLCDDPHSLCDRDLLGA